MTVTSHLYPKAIAGFLNGTLDADSDSFKAVLFTGDASAWGSTQQAYQFLSDLISAYTECADADYSRISLAGLSITESGNKVIWSCTSPISFGSAVTISARSMAIVDTTVGTTDATHPVVSVIDFGQAYSSSAGPWEYDVDGTNGLGYITSS